MSEQHDPRRLLGDPEFAELEGGLRSARARGPSAEQLARMRAALGLAAAPAPSAPPAPVAAPASSARVSWLKLIAGGVLVIGAAIGLWRGAVRGPHLEPPGVTAPRSLAQPAPAPVAPAPAPAPTTPPPAVREHGGAGASSAPLHRTAARVVRSAAKNAAPADPAAELALLKRAKADARSAPAHALALVAEHEQRFPNGVLVEEREVIAIEALLASGQRGAGEARAARFFTRFANSAHARRVHALLDDSASQSDTKSSAAPHP